MAVWRKYSDVLLKNLYKLQHLVLWIPQVKTLIVWLIFLSGSFIHDFFPLPGSYFSNKRNIFNVFFVKRGWGWTCGLMLVFIFMNLARKEVGVKIVWKHILRLFYGTLLWFTFTTIFEQIESWTGHCEGDVINESKMDCLGEGLQWVGFDISGHCFLLTFCILLINEELFAFTTGHSGKTREKSDFWDFDQRTLGKATQRTVLISLSILLTLLMILWEFMLFFTCVYFHTVHQKASGTVLGIFAWYLIYKVAVNFKHPLMPNAPNIA